METQNQGNTILRSTFTGIGFTLLYLLIGLVLAYMVTQILSQFFIANCSEDCYFRIFNISFAIVALLSLTGGLWSGIHAYRHKSEKA